jgi:hypothetical protein
MTHASAYEVTSHFLESVDVNVNDVAKSGKSRLHSKTAQSTMATCLFLSNVNMTTE